MSPDDPMTDEIAALRDRAVAAVAEAATLDDLRAEIKDFDGRARILSIRVMRGDWPAQRSIAGSELPRDTPVENLWNVGDGVTTYANGGVQACAETAKLVVEDVLERYGVAT
jgi:hypothetical protein